MNTRFTRLSLVAALIVTGAMSVNPANAGGLFGDHGLIRGSVGKFMHDNVQAPILTPILQGAVVGVGAAAGAAAGAYVGAPEIGGAVGTAFGQGVNNFAAGNRGSGFEPSNAVPAESATSDGDNGFQPAPSIPMPIVQMGNFCSTPIGRFGPGPVNPLGSSCNIMGPNGYIFGQVTL